MQCVHDFNQIGKHEAAGNVAHQEYEFLRIITNTQNSTNSNWIKSNIYYWYIGNQMIKWNILWTVTLVLLSAFFPLSYSIRCHYHVCVKEDSVYNLSSTPPHFLLPHGPPCVLLGYKSIIILIPCSCIEALEIKIEFQFQSFLMFLHVCVWVTKLNQGWGGADKVKPNFGNFIQ